MLDLASSVVFFYVSHELLSGTNPPPPMGKAGKERKRRKLLQEQQNPSALAHGSGDGDDNDEATVCGVSAAEAATATKVLVALAAAPEAFRGKEFKALRAALHTLRQSEGASMVLGFGMCEVALVQVVSDALRDSRWSDALGALEKMRQRKQVLKLGSLCPLSSLAADWHPLPKSASSLKAPHAPTPLWSRRCQSLARCRGGSASATQPGTTTPRRCSCWTRC